MYLTFATNTSAFEACLFALTGSEAFQWMKVCNKFTRFCYQIGGAILCCYIASILMAMISTISAYKVLRMYSPKRFLRLKGKWSKKWKRWRNERVQARGIGTHSWLHLLSVPNIVWICLFSSFFIFLICTKVLFEHSMQVLFPLLNKNKRTAPLLRIYICATFFS